MNPTQTVISSNRINSTQKTSNKSMIFIGGLFCLLLVVSLYYTFSTPEENK